ncbi:MAG: pantoate--beta-alanine ligase [Bernardetiaceae bacterium]|jgi:pantoate--beta-alanine ligase|nr:pantoate--beta-alanine ligase [Bernardetiaceae bacterium]
MQVFDTVTGLQTYLALHRASQTIGLVPTMGALHAGHLALVAQARTECSLVVASIFVNPTQFNNPDDLKHYPRTLEADLALLEAAGCHVVFAPTEAEMYACPPVLRLSFGELEQRLEGAHRPGHFNGVGLVVSKLFHQVQPQVAYFGQKDLQQCLVVQQLVQDLAFPLQLRRCPTVREADGLAMSSRNRRLGEAERQVAPRLHQSLQRVVQSAQQGAPVAQALAQARAWLEQSGAFSVEYLEVADTEQLRPVTQLTAGQTYAVLVAAQLGPVRLIDNLLFQAGA